MTARGEIQNNGVVRLRSGGTKKSRVGQLTVPAKYSRCIPFGTRFHVEPVEEGLLFRYIGPPEIVNDIPTTQKLPIWLKNLGS